MTPGRPDRTGNITMIKLFKAIKSDKRGASAAEYALMIAVMGGIVVAAVIALGGQIGTGLTTAQTNLAQAQAGNGGGGGE